MGDAWGGFAASRAVVHFERRCAAIREIAACFGQIEISLLRYASELSAAQSSWDAHHSALESARRQGMADERAAVALEVPFRAAAYLLGILERVAGEVTADSRRHQAISTALHNELGAIAARLRLLQIELDPLAETTAGASGGSGLGSLFDHVMRGMKVRGPGWTFEDAFTLLAPMFLKSVAHDLAETRFVKHFGTTNPRIREGPIDRLLRHSHGATILFAGLHALESYEKSPSNVTATRVAGSGLSTAVSVGLGVPGALIDFATGGLVSNSPTAIPILVEGLVRLGAGDPNWNDSWENFTDSVHQGEQGWAMKLLVDNTTDFVYDHIVSGDSTVGRDIRTGADFVKRHLGWL